MRLLLAPAPLAPLVLGVCVLRGQGAAETIAMPAHALATFTVVLRGSLQMAGAGAGLAMGSLAAAGCATRAQEFIASPDVIAATLLCRASVLPLLHGESAHLFCDAPAPAALLAELDIEAWCRAAPRASDEELAAALIQAAQRKLEGGRQRSSAQQFAGALARWKHGGACSVVPEGWAERQWQRACRAELGLSPKLLQRLVRLHGSVAAAPQALAAPSWAEHALEAGYCDQPHLAREYRALGGVSPGASRAGAGLALRQSASLLVPRFFGH